MIESCHSMHENTRVYAFADEYAFEVKRPRDVFRMRRSLAIGR